MRDELTSSERELLDAYFAGAHPPESREQVDALLARHAKVQAQMSAWRAGACAADVPAEVVPTADVLYDQWTQRLATANESQQARAIQRPRRRPIQGGLALSRRAVSTGIAAFALALLGIGLFRWAPGTRSASSHVRTYATTIGQQATIVLSDSSRITLAPLSHLAVREDVRGPVRDVSLDGEAYFEVIPGKHTPFVVQTGSVATRVLGTTFNIRHYSSDSAVSVFVATGKVSVEGSRKRATLVAGMAALVTDSTATIVAAEPTKYVAWKEGRLVFDSVPASVVLATVSRWYGYEFAVEDSALATQRVTAVFEIAKQRETMAALRSLLGVTMTFEGRTVLLRPRRHNESPAPRPRGDRDVILTRTEVGR